MATLNHPDKIELDAYSDPNLQAQAGNGTYYRFTNTLKNPIIGAKAIQLSTANFINSSLQLNDWNGQLIFFFYASNTNNLTLANLHNIRLHPANFVPNQTGPYTAYVKNKYWTNVADLVAALNLAASTGGDSATYNPTWLAGQLTFSYDANTRKISVVSTSSSIIIAPAAADDPNVIDLLTGKTNPNNRIRMNSFSSDGSYAGSPLQPYFVNNNYPSGPDYTTMNARLGFAMSYYATPLWRNASYGYYLGCATSTGAPLASPNAIEADANPILLGVQNVNVYVDVVTGSGMDSLGRKNLLGSVPIDVPPLNINSYTLTSTRTPAMSVPNEIYQITVELYDDTGAPFYQPPNYNTELALAVFY
jgi:hypothetical protein